MKCFVISPIGSDGSDIRSHADNVYDYIICEALNPLGFDVERADKISESGIITTQIIERIVSSDLVVADLSGLNANVFYELALRHVTGKPFIHLIEDGQTIPFDVSVSRTIFYTLDLPGAKKASHELRGQAEFSLDLNNKVENPISVAIDLKALDGSADPIAATLGRMENDISIIKNLIIESEEVNIINSNEELKNIISKIFFKLGDENKEKIEVDSINYAMKYWTEKRVSRLMVLWKRGLSPSQIASELGDVSRNAVIRKAHRIGLPSRSEEN